MMFTWIADLLVVSGLLGLSALLLERILRPRHRPTRGPWLLAMLASLLIPSLASWMGPHTQATRAPIVVAAATSEPAGNAPHHWSSWVDLDASSLGDEGSRRRDRFIALLWACSSALTASVIVLSGWQFRRQRRGWRLGHVCGVPVWIAPDAGPVVLGVLTPQIVVPEWIVRAPLDTQRCVVTHEQAHVEAGDSRLLTLSMILVALTPWNPLLWWQARRLRVAIEVDCDRRVLNRGHDLRCYAKVLLQFGLRRSNLLSAVASMFESPSTLERRIALMTQPKRTRWTIASAAVTLLALGSVLAASQFIPPPLALAAATSSAQAMALDSYVGHYEFASVTVLDIQRQQDQLSAVFPGAPGDLLASHGADEFRCKNVDATIRFKRDPEGQIAGLSFEQNGEVTYAPRIAAARLQAIQGKIAERYRKQIAAPGSEAALRRLIEGIQSGLPNYSEMSQQLAGGTRTMLQNFQSTMRPLGPIQSINFKGVNKAGWDEYLVKHAQGDARWQIALDDKDVIVGALVHAGS